MAESSSAMYFAVSNIPAAFRSANLRNFFSQFIESNGFLCFHYRHRPEILKESEGTQVNMSDHTSRDIPTTEMPSTDVEEGTEESGSSPKSIKTCCCVVSVPSNEAARLVKMYAGNQWIDSKGNWLARRCVIRKVKVSPSTG